MNLVCIDCGTLEPDCGCVIPTCNCGSKVFLTEDGYYKLKDKGIIITNHVSCNNCKVKGNINGNPILFCSKINKQINIQDDCKA